MKCHLFLLAFIIFSQVKSFALTDHCQWQVVGQNGPQSNVGKYLTVPANVSIESVFDNYQCGGHCLYQSEGSLDQSLDFSCGCVATSFVGIGNNVMSSSCECDGDFRAIGRFVPLNYYSDFEFMSK
jgi:hypothetical protein